MPPLPAGATSVTCRFCQSTITVDRGAPPPPAAAPPAAPTLYLGAEGEKLVAQNTKLTFIALAIFIGAPLLVLGGIFFGPDVYHSLVPYPRSCDGGADVYASGDWDGATPIFTKVGDNCRIHVTKSKLTGSTLFAATGANIEVWIDNSTIRTSDVMMKPAPNMKLHITKSTLTSKKYVIDEALNLQVDITGSTLTSEGDTAIHAGVNETVKLDNAHIVAKKTAIAGGQNLTLDLKNDSRITSEDQLGVKADINCHITAAEGQIQGSTGGISATDNLSIQGNHLKVLVPNANAIDATTNLKMDLQESAIKSTTQTAIASGEGSYLTLADTTVSGGTALVTGNDLTLNLTSASVLGLHGAIATGSNLRLKGTGSIEGGNGAGIAAKSTVDISFPTASIKGHPPIQN